MSSLEKPEKFDFVIEAKACSVELTQTVLTYCNIMAIEYFFIMCNVIAKKGKPPMAHLIQKISLTSTTNLEDLADTPAQNRKSG